MLMAAVMLTVSFSGTAFAALTKWLLNKDSWLHATPEAIKSLVAKMNQATEQPGRSELAIMGWDSHADGGMKDANDWETGDIQIDEASHSLTMNGTSCCSEYEFEILVKPVEPLEIKGYNDEVSSEETGHTQEYTDARYLMELSERIFRIPVMHGVDQGDYEELREIAGRLDEQARMDHLNEYDD